MRITQKIFHPTSLIDDVYEFSIILKAIGGLIECISGIGLLFISPVQIQSVVAAITRSELLEDPHDFIASHLMHWSSHLGLHSTLFGAIYLLSHGVLKIGIVIALLFKKQWAYPAAIAVFSGFAIYQIYATVAKASIGYALLTVYDLFVIYLVWLEYKKAKAADESP
ncbi:MAG: hypothetical protein JWO41_332 [Candidatus Saccharibacteria bacterium]|nr:hypothetical protein [Candidatus Saccharibacteria bacterium]